MADPSQLRAQEYQFLTDAIVKRVEMRQQLVLAMLIAAGTFLPLGIGNNADSRILLVYPIISACLVSAWAHNGKALSVAADYILKCIEKSDPSIGWERYLAWRFGPKPVFGFTEFLSTTALALVTQSLALLYAWPRIRDDAVEELLAIAATLSIIATLGVSVDSATQRKRQNTGVGEAHCPE